MMFIIGLLRGSVFVNKGNMTGRKNHFGGPFRRGCNKNADDVCVCPSCGYIVEYERGVPCNSLLCPKCNSHLIRKIVLEMSEKVDQKKENNLKGEKAYPKVNPELCMNCGSCEDICPTGAVSIIDNVAFIDEDNCKKCRICVTVCPVEAIN